MSSGIRHDADVTVGKYSRYSVGRPWASGREGMTAPITYGFCGWREDAGEGEGAPNAGMPAFPPLKNVIERVIAYLHLEQMERSARHLATLAALRANPYRALSVADGHLWTMGAREAALAVLGTGRAADGLLAQPEFQAAWEAALGLALKREEVSP